MAAELAEELEAAVAEADPELLVLLELEEVVEVPLVVEFALHPACAGCWEVKEGDEG